MMTEHGAPCSGDEATYCMNGGTCYSLPAMNTLSCVCKEDFKGSRCEQFQLQSRISDAREAGLIAAVVIVTLLALVVLVLVVYYVRRMLKMKQQSKKKTPQPQYWKITPRV